MANPDRPAIHIPNFALVLGAIALAAVAGWSYSHGDRETATMTIAGAGLFLSALRDFGPVDLQHHLSGRASQSPRLKLS
jgi:hypothetical protein